jgi:hypothetical protein|nr:MAG TPA: hypothetical protein [Caudoviricetes sp.]
MRKLLKQIDDWIDQKYEEIKKSENMLNEMRKVINEISKEDASLAIVVQNRLINKAIKEDYELLHKEIDDEEQAESVTRKEKEKQMKFILLFLLGWFIGEILVKM